MSQRNIGEVSFGQLCPEEENSGGWKFLEIMGEERVQLLRRVRDGVPLPDGMIFVGQVPGGYERITREDVKWEGMRE